MKIGDIDATDTREACRDRSTALSSVAQFTGLGGGLARLGIIVADVVIVVMVRLLDGVSVLITDAVLTTYAATGTSEAATAKDDPDGHRAHEQSDGADSEDEDLHGCLWRCPNTGELPKRIEGGGGLVCEAAIGRTDNEVGREPLVFSQLRSLFLSEH